MKRIARILVIGVLIVATVTLQNSIFSHFSLSGVVPDLAMLVVIAVALVRGPDYGATVGFAAGLVLDLAPPADHTAGRWALSLLLVGYVIGLARGDAESSALSAIFMVAAGAFIGTSVFALTGLVLGDPGVSVSLALEVVPRAILYDVLLTPLVIPLVMVALRRLEPTERW
ncbi:MAG: rod shape-determining protein MreD [Nocardioidaceae bacterium]